MLGFVHSDDDVGAFHIWNRLPCYGSLLAAKIIKVDGDIENDILPSIGYLQINRLHLGYRAGAQKNQPEFWVRWVVCFQLNLKVIMCLVPYRRLM